MIFQKGLVEDIKASMKDDEVAKQFLKQIDAICLCKDEEYSNDNLFTPSMCGSCERNIYFRLTEEETEKKKPFQIRRLDNGTAIHRRIESYMKQWDKLSEMGKPQFFRTNGIEVSGKNEELKLGGTADGLLQYVNGEKEFPLGFEFKTIADYGFKTLEEVKPLHIWQCTGYSLIFPEYTKWIVVYEKFEKTSGKDMKAYVVNITPEMQEELKRSLKYVEECLETKTIPPKNQCKCKDTYCSFKKICEQIP